MVENWIWFTGVFSTGTITEKIIFIVLIVLLTIFALWLAFQIIKFAFWLSAEIIKASLLGSAMIIYTVVTVFILAPIGLTAQEKDLTYIIDTYVNDLIYMITIFYPKTGDKLKIWIEKYNTNEKYRPFNTCCTPHIQKKINTRRNARRNLSSSIDNSTLFCVDCGTKFNNIVINALIQKHNAYCQKCGKKYNIENGRPIPASE